MKPPPSTERLTVSGTLRRGIKVLQKNRSLSDGLKWTISFLGLTLGACPCQADVRKTGGHENVCGVWLLPSLWVSSRRSGPPIFPITEVTLYKHGVAHLERSGEFEARARRLALDFKPDDANDDVRPLHGDRQRHGGKVNRVRYRFEAIRLEKQLADFPFQLGGGVARGAFLDQMKRRAHRTEAET